MDELNALLLPKEHEILHEAIDNLDLPPEAEGVWRFCDAFKFVLTLEQAVVAMRVDKQCALRARC